MNDNESTVNECVLVVESIFKKCMDDAVGDKAIAAQLFEKLVLKDPVGFSCLLEEANLHYESLENIDKLESIQILNELIDEKLKSGVDTETIKKQIITSSEKDVKLRVALRRLEELAKNPLFILDDDNKSH